MREILITSSITGVEPAKLTLVKTLKNNGFEVELAYADGYLICRHDRFLADLDFEDETVPEADIVKEITNEIKRNMSGLYNPGSEDNFIFNSLEIDEWLEALDQFEVLSGFAKQLDASTEIQVKLQDEMGLETLLEGIEVDSVKLVKNDDDTYNLQAVAESGKLRDSKLKGPSALDFLVEELNRTSKQIEAIENTPKEVIDALDALAKRWSDWNDERGLDSPKID